MDILCYKLEAQVSFNEESIEKMLMLCEEVIDYITHDERAKFKLKSAIHELLANSVEHGYHKSPGKVSIMLKKEQSSISLEVCDEGTGLDPSTIDLTRQIHSLDAAPERGWGLIIIHSLADSMSITPNSPGGTRVHLTVSV